MAYCLDTSCLIEAWDRRYPPDVFPQLWATMEQCCRDGTLIAPDEVRVKLEAKADALLDWAKSNSQLFIALDGEQMVETQHVLAEFPRLVGQLNNRHRADAFVIALARVRDCAVVTEEGASIPARPRIPLVCDHFGIRCITTVQLIRELGLRF